MHSGSSAFVVRDETCSIFSLTTQTLHPSAPERTVYGHEHVSAELFLFCKRTFQKSRHVGPFAAAHEWRSSNQVQPLREGGACFGQTCEAGKRPNN